MNVSVTIAPRLELSVSGARGGNVEFGVVHKTGKTQEAAAGEVLLEAQSNMGQPYQITHMLVSPLTSAQGRRMADADIRVDTQNLFTQGQPVTDSAVTTQPAVIFQSNPTGQSDTIKANYRLKVNPDQPEGHYSTRLVYSILAL